MMWLAKLSRRAAASGALVGIAALVYALWIVTYPVFDYDLYWHLANGREMLARGEPIQRELFSYTHPNEPFPHLYHSWLAQGLFYVLWQLGGGLALLALKLVITAAVTWLVYRAGRDFGASPVAAALCAASAILAGILRFLERPELFSLLGMAALGAVLAGHLSGGRRASWLAVLPFLLLLWDCLHGAVYGFALFGIVVAVENLKGRLPWQHLDGWCALPRGRLRALNLAFAASVAVGFLNPYGLATYLSFIEIVTGKAAYDAGYSRVVEFQPPLWKDFKVFFLLLGLGFLALIARGRRANPTHILAFVAFGLMAARISRITGVFAIVAAPLVAASAHAWLQRFVERGSVIRGVLAAVMALALLGYGVKVKHAEPGSPQAFGVHVDERFLPGGVVRFVKDRDVRGNMYNTGHFGGYLAFMLSPERPIFQYNLPMIFGDTYRYPAHPEELARWNIDYAIVGMAEELDRLFPRAAWARVYRDESAVLVVRRAPEHAALIERYELRHFHPLMNEGQVGRALSDPSVAPRFVLEVSDYLTYKKDPRWAERLRAALVIHPELAADEPLRGALERSEARQLER